MSRRFDGIDDYISCGDATAIQNLTVVTYSCWFYLDAFTTAAGMRMAGKLDSFNIVDTGGPVGYTNDTIQFFSFWSGTDGSWYGADNSVTTGVWTHAAVTYDASATTNSPVIYVNGSPISISAGATPTGTHDNDGGNNFDIGNNATPGVRPFDGELAEVGYWNRALTAAEITLLSKGYSPLSIPNGLRLYYPLKGLYGVEQNLIDRSNGTITGAVLAPSPKITYPNKLSLLGVGT